MRLLVFAMIPFALFCFLAVLLTRRRFSVRTTVVLWASVIGAVSVTHLVLFVLDMDRMLLLSLLPVTAYLPVGILFFVLSKRNVVSNLLAMLIALLSSVSVILLDDFAGALWTKGIETAGNWGPVYTILHIALPLAASAGIGFVCFRFLRKVFGRERVLENTSWYAVPAVFLLLLFSLYQKELLRQPLMIAFLLVMDGSVLAVMIAFVVSKYKNTQAEARRAAAERQLAAERAQYGALRTSLERDRRYRHDMKHHFTAIAALAERGNNAEIGAYVSALGAKLSDTEAVRYCENGVVNAVLAQFREGAERAGVRAEIEAKVPENPPADECDLCALVGNALDNALNACKKTESGDRRIEARVRCDGARILVRVTNTVAERVVLGKDGLPLCERTEHHGWGMSSMGCIVEKYGGLMKCLSEEKSFTLIAVLFRSPEAVRPRKRNGKAKALVSLAALPLVLLSAILSVNCMPATAQALGSLPGVGRVVEIIDFRKWGWQWGDSGTENRKPITSDPGADEIIDGYVKACRDKFRQYYARKYQGYTAAEFSYLELVNDQRIYVLRMSCLIYAGSSAEYLRYFVVDKAEGKILSLSDLFAPGSDWNDRISGEIRRQMEATVQAGEGDYFGMGIFDDTPGFTRLDDPNFYLDETYTLVIVFDEQEIAPGNMGSPSFRIPVGAVEEILAEDSLLKGGGR